MCLTPTSTGFRLAVRAQPRSSREAIVGVHDGALKIAITAPPVDGEANAALIAFLARTLGVSKKQVRLQRGDASKTKLFEIDGVSEADARRSLGL